MEALRRLPEPETLNEAERAIARTVLYAALFDYPLTLAQLRQTLIERTMTATEILKLYDASEPLQAVVACEDGFFLPRGRPEIVVERRRRETRSRRFLDRQRLLLTLVCSMPYVRMVALSGSVAHLNMDGRGDLDLFIVTRGKRVWLISVATVILAKLLRRRSTLCANFVVSDERLVFENQDLFTANQIVNLKPLAGGPLLAEIIARNPFVSRFYPNFHPAASRLAGFRPLRPFRRTRAVTERLLQVPSAFAEVVCRSAYRTYLRRKSHTWDSPDNVRLDDDSLKLHTHSHRERIVARFASETTSLP